MKRIFLPLVMVVALLTACSKTSDKAPACAKETSNVGAEDDAQAKNPFVFNIVVQLDGSNEVPPVNTTAKGQAHLKLSTDKILYSKVMVERLEPNDTLTAAHIHAGATGTNGPVKIFLAHSADDFGKNMETLLTDDQYNFLLSNVPAYVNAHSKRHPGGLIRGQLK